MLSGPLAKEYCDSILLKRRNGLEITLKTWRWMQELNRPWFSPFVEMGEEFWWFETVAQYLAGVFFFFFFKANVPKKKICSL